MSLFKYATNYERLITLIETLILPAPFIIGLLGLIHSLDPKLVYPSNEFINWATTITAWPIAHYMINDLRLTKKLLLTKAKLAKETTSV